MLSTQFSYATGGDHAPRADLSPPQRWGLAAGAVVLHAIVAIVVWKASSVPDAPAEPAPLMVSLITDQVQQVAPPTPPVPEPPKPTPPKPVVTPKVQPTVVASNRAPAPQDMVVPAAPEPPTPAPPPVVEAPPTAPVSTAPEPTTPPPPKVLPSSSIGILVDVKPAYPPASQELGESGTVTVLLLIDDQGQLKDIRVSKSSGYPRLDRAAMAAARQARYRPYMEAGVPRSYSAPRSFTFNLEER